jgi:hypothetical protein
MSEPYPQEPANWKPPTCPWCGYKCGTWAEYVFDHAPACYGFPVVMIVRQKP